MKFNARMGLRIVMVLVIVAVFAWRQWGPRHASEPATATAKPVSVAAASSAAAAPVKPVPPQTITVGTLKLTACELKSPDARTGVPAFCADFAVPENRADAKSRRIDLKLAIVKSESALPEPDMVTYLAGGPGQSAIETYPMLAPSFAALAKHRDILLLDQRGTGGSHPLACPATEKQLQGSEDLPFDAARLQADIKTCLAEVEQHADPRYYTTTVAVADLEAVRQALGAPQLDLIGISYGTRMAQQYAGTHPAAVRSIVLDSVAPNSLILGQTFAADLERALTLQVAACAQAPACKRAFGDWWQTLLDLRAKLDAHPLAHVSFPDPRTSQPLNRTVNGDVVANYAHMFAYNAEASALLPLAITQAAQGNYTPLLGQAQLSRGELGSNMNGGMQMSVICAEDAPFLTSQPQVADSLLGTRPIERIQALCSVWPRGDMPKNFHQPFKSAIPTLVLSGELDPVTPPRFAKEVMQGLSNARLLSLKGRGHGELVIGCMPKLVNQFIDQLDPKGLNTKCLDRIGPVPAFIDFNGAAP